MISRRRLLQVGTAAAGALTSTPLVATNEPCPALPPSIATLKSMKDQATPISKEERAARQEKARELMTEQHIDAILLMQGTSLNYFTGIRWWGGERLFAMVLPARGAAFYVCPAFEQARAREQIAKGPSQGDPDVRTWEEDDDPYERVAQGLADRGISAGTLGIEETVLFVFSRGIAQAVPQAKIVSATPVTAGCRMIKSDHEIALMRMAAKVTFNVYQAAYQAIKEGMTKPQLEDLIAAAYDRVGFPGDVDVQIDQNTSNPHGSAAQQVIREGSIIMMDDGCRVEGYTSDITRTFTLGKPSDKMKKVFDIVQQAQSKALRTARPGLQCQMVDIAARKVIVDSGYGPDYKYFTHRLGHGMGMDGHEWPYLVAGNKLAMARNMTFSDEPGIYIRGEFGIRLEDDMHITENGAELFTPQSPSLEDPFGRA
ncbi:MAG: aminopeptidase P family protein [Acidobacteriaceae bacterium]|nr:aminopeptidase P family protein [Acidobacteriaceae bacterium]